MMDGCPLIVMPDDPASVEYILKAIMQPNFFLPPPSPSQYHIVAAVLRPAHKYDAATFRDRALRHLSARYPCTLRDFLHRDKHSRPLFGSYDRENGEAEAYATDTAVLLHEVGAWWCLPAVYEAILPKISAAFILNGVHFASRHYEVSHEQKVGILDGPQNFTQDLATRVAHISFPSTNCEEKERCTSTYHSLLFVYLTKLQRRTGPWFWNLDFKNALPLCQPCRAKMNESIEQLADEIWTSIPGYFSLPPWSELKTMKQATLGYVDEYNG
ncbi:hypothetical protein DL96DRAFT_1284807 [Flagelloscypha sp. PMI_526]|nr:hypothetical protein DL96DRAFT_1284807 [Flagelloscypha sp. PMI_526]